jgi:hypothetical protein
MDFAKRFVPVGPVAFPGIIISDIVTEEVERRNGTKVRTQFAQVLTLRTTNPDNGPVVEFVHESREDLGWCPLRFDTVPGLDDTPMEVLQQRRLANILARNAARAEAQGPRTLTLSAPIGSDSESEDESDA